MPIAGRLPRAYIPLPMGAVGPRMPLEHEGLMLRVWHLGNQIRRYQGIWRTPGLYDASVVLDVMTEKGYVNEGPCNLSAGLGIGGWRQIRMGGRQKEEILEGPCIPFSGPWEGDDSRLGWGAVREMKYKSARAMCAPSTGSRMLGCSG